MDFPGGPSANESACQCRKCGFHPWTGKISWGRKWQPTPGFLPGKFRGHRSLVGYAVHGITTHRTRPSDWAHTHTRKCVSLSHKHWGDHKGYDMITFCFKSWLWLLHGRFKWEIWGCKETKWETITIIHVKDVGGFRLKQCQTKRKMNLRYI